MENLKNIVKGTVARLSYICEGKASYQIETASHLYQLEINTTDEEWKATYLYPEFKSIILMRWIRRGLELNDGSFILLK